MPRSVLQLAGVDSNQRQTPSTDASSSFVSYFTCSKAWPDTSPRTVRPRTLRPTSTSPPTLCYNIVNTIKEC